MTDRTPARQAYLDLQRLAKSDRRNTQELLDLYTLEGVLARLAVSPHRENLVLKGGVLLAAWGNRRPTRDVDLEALVLSNDPDTVVSVLREILAESVDDGLTFDLDSLAPQVIRDEEEYSGVRVSCTAHLDTARITFHVDVSVGDPIHPAPVQVTVPGLLQERPDISVLGYPMPMTLAEKLVTAMQRGIASTRWRDFGDIWTLSRSHDIDGEELSAAIDTVTAARGATVTSLRDVLDGYAAIAQPKWSAWRRRLGRELVLPEQFDEVVKHTITFADPVFERRVSGLTWVVAEQRWR